MVPHMLAKTSYVRLGAFAAVLLLSSALLVTLFDEASAATVEVNEIGRASGGAHNIDVDIVVPDGQRVPIEKLTAAIETRANGEATKTSSSDVSLASLASCASVIAGCTSAQIQEIDGTPGVLTAVEFTGAQVDGQTISNGYFDEGTLNWDHESGYGYDTVAGYGYDTGGPSPGPGTTGYGYGYNGGELTLSFRFTISPSTLGNGDYWFTSLAETGSTVTGPLSSPATPFTVGSLPGGGGSGSGSGTTITAGSTTAPAGATGAWSAEGQTHSADTTITIDTGSDDIPEIEFTLDQDIDNADIEIVLWPADNPPEGTGDLPGNVQGVYFVQITISNDDGTTHTVVINVEVDVDDVGDADPDKAVGLKWNPGNSWTPISKVDLTEGDDGFTGSFEASCCSSFALAFDEESPTISLGADSDPVTQGGMVTFTADAADNLGVDRVEFSLDGELVHTAGDAPYTWEWDTSGVSLGEHLVEAVAYDTVGNDAQTSETSQVDEREGGTDDDDDDDDDDGDDVGIPAPAAVIVLVAVGAILVALRRRK